MVRSIFLLPLILLVLLTLLGCASNENNANISINISLGNETSLPEANLTHEQVQNITEEQGSELTEGCDSSSCIREKAINASDVSLCYNIDKTDNEFSRCIYDVVVRNGDYVHCSEILDANLKDRCFFRTAKDLEMLELCKNIIEAAKREECGGQLDDVITTTETFETINPPIESWRCMENGKPVVRFFSSTTCSGCTWARDAFIEAVSQYEGKIVARLWQVDIKDDLLTPTVENVFPYKEAELYIKYVSQTLPVYIFGCDYIREGNGYEKEKNLNKEKSEFELVINLLLNESVSNGSG